MDGEDEMGRRYKSTPSLTSVGSTKGVGGGGGGVGAIVLTPLLKGALI